MLQLYIFLKNIVHPKKLRHSELLRMMNFVKFQEVGFLCKNFLHFAALSSNDEEITNIEAEIKAFTFELNRPCYTIPRVGASIILSEYGDISKFKSLGQMLSFAGLEPGYFQSSQSEHTGHMVKRGSSQLRCAIINC